MAHKKKVFEGVAIGEWVSCGVRGIRVDSVDGEIAKVTLRVSKQDPNTPRGKIGRAEDIEIIDPFRRERYAQGSWVQDDPGDYDLVEEQVEVVIGSEPRSVQVNNADKSVVRSEKIRVGQYRQFRVFPETSSTVSVVVVAPAEELQ